jgi:ribosomal protein S18 acetylase RimI-like enzyme
MTHSTPRLATLDDLSALVALEMSCFNYDQLTKRSFRYFITKAQAQLWVIGDPVEAYGLVLFHRGTCLARIYSLAVSPLARGKGHGRALMAVLEQASEAQGALFIRLEVAEDNRSAIALYESLHYQPIRRLHQYYEDGHDGIRMEKRLLRHLPKPAHLPHFAQTTDFTCGPAALLMAMKYLRPSLGMTQMEEINLWREATTVFMTRGHGGTSPLGLALAAKARGFDSALWLSSPKAPFLASVRSESKKHIIEMIHEDFLARSREQAIPMSGFPKSLDTLKEHLAEGWAVILLISTYRFNRSKEPHWVWLVHIDEGYAYINDPDVDAEHWQSALDNIYVPVPIKDFEQMMKYGSTPYRSAILLRNPA